MQEYSKNKTVALLGAIIAVLLLICGGLYGCGTDNGVGGKADNDTKVSSENKESGSRNVEGKTVFLAIECTTAAEKKASGDLKESVAEVVPSDGVILPKTEVKLKNGDNVLKVLLRTAKKEDIHTSFQGETKIGTAYVDGIGNLFEKDCGKRSGWMYSVNGKYPMLGTEQYELKGGEDILFTYTCNNGKDIGAKLDEKSQ